MSQLLLTGEPDLSKVDEGTKDVTTTTFVLPFAYRLERVGAQYPNDSSLHYDWVNVCSADAGATIDALRPQYFSRETAESLYRNAQWYEIDALAWGENDIYPTRFLFRREGRDLPVELLAPRLVLFERDHGTGTHSATDVRHTGFLLLQMCFPESAEWQFDDLLEFNETFRYTERNFPAHFETRISRHYPDLVEQLAKHEAPEVSDNSDAEAIFFQERWLRLLRDVPIRDPQEGAFRLFDRPAALNDLMPIADNRALVWSVAMLPEHGVKSLCTEGEEAPFCGNLVRFVNVDGPGKGSPTDFETRWLKDRIYTRWLRYGSVYGFTSHSGVLVASRDPGSPIAMHFQRIYLDMFLLVYYLRISLNRFSAELVSASAYIRERDDRSAEGRFEALRRDFTLLTNLYQFPTVSNQQQAQEIYPIMRRVLEVDVLFEETATEIDKTHQFLQLLNDKRTQRKLNWFGGIIGAFTIFDAVLNHVGASALLIIGVVSAGLFCFGMVRKRRSKGIQWANKRLAAAEERLRSWLGRCSS